MTASRFKSKTKRGRRIINIREIQMKRFKIAMIKRRGRKTLRRGSKMIVLKKKLRVRRIRIIERSNRSTIVSIIIIMLTC